MKTKFLFLLFACACLATSTANAQVAFTFSTSSTDPLAGSVLDLTDGDTGTLFIFAENNDASGNDIDGLALDVIGTGSPLIATGFDIDNPGGTRWLLGTSPGTLGSSPDALLVDDSNAGGFILTDANGIQNGVGPVFHSALTFDTFGLGSSSLVLAEGALEISVEGSDPVSIDFGTATVNVSAIPEPSSLCLLGSIAGGLFLRRRRQM